MFKNTISLLIAAIMLTACLSTPIPGIGTSIPGNSLADKTLKYDTFRMVKPVVLARNYGCAFITIVNTQVTDTSQLNNPSKPSWRETWTADACGTKWNVPILFTLDGHGGTYMAVETNIQQIQ